MQTLHGTTALVTGGSRGIGRAIVLKLASLGAEVVIHYHRNYGAAEKTRSEAGGTGRLIQADLGSIPEIDSMFDALGDLKLDFLINNAGIWSASPLGSSSAERVTDIININLRGVFWLTQRALALMKDGGRIINVSSVAGRTGVAGGRSLYGATKAAIDSLTKNWALELAPRGILVNAVAPGYVTTDMTAAHFSDAATLDRALKRHPLGRLSKPEDVADVAAFLCTDAARFITGQSINVSGGFVI